MRHMKAFAAAAALACAPLAAAPALAQSGAVIVVDSRTLITQSTAGRDMEQRLQGILTQMRAEIQPEEQALANERQAIGQATQGQSEQQIRANTQLTQRITAFNTRMEAFLQRQQGLERDYQYTASQAVVEFNRQLTPIVQEVMAARNAAVVVDRGNVMLRNDAVDATQDVLTRLDQRVRTINVTRQTAPPPQQPQTGQQR